MAFSKTDKALMRAKYGDKLVDAMIAAENVFLTDEGTEISLIEKLAAIITSIGTKASSDDLNTVSGKVDTIVGSDTNKSARVIAGEVLAAAGKLTRTKVDSVDDIDPTAEHADEYIYMVPKSGAKSGDKYDEYMVIDGAVEKVGDWEVDLSNYLQKISGTTDGEIVLFTADGGIKKSGKTLADYVEAEQGKGLSTNDYDATEKQKVAEAYAAKHGHDNKTVLDGITAEKVTAWDGATHVYASPTQPENLKNGDIWLQTFTE